MTVTVYRPNELRRFTESVAPVDQFGRFAYDGFGVYLDDQQLEAILAHGDPGPRLPGEKKDTYVSGGQRSGKTVLLALGHAKANLYKTGVDNADERFWNNYLYKTLALAPSTDLTLRLWQVMDELAKGASDAQYDRKARKARPAALRHFMSAGKAGPWPVVNFVNGSRCDFRSTEGWATRLEGDQWWWITWDEWASQPDREIEFVHRDVLYGRARDHDGKIVLAAWPKQMTERHLLSVLRSVESGYNTDAQVLYLDASKAYFSNVEALKVERRKKDAATWQRTVQGIPAGGASVEFKRDLIENMVDPTLPEATLREPGYLYLSSWDIGLSHDSTVGITWRVPIIGGRGVVTPASKVRYVHTAELRPSETLTLDTLAFNIRLEQQVYGGQTAVDASGLGGVAAFRQLRDMTPPPLSFVSRSNDRIHGNMRLAAITNGLDMLSWGRPNDDADASKVAWGLVEGPRIVRLLDQLANFDREAKDVPDDWVWAFLIGLWYIRRFWVVGNPNLHSTVPLPFRRADYSFAAAALPAGPKRTIIPMRRRR